MEIYAISAADKRFGYKRGNLSGLNSGKDIPKTIFLLLWQDCGIILGKNPLVRERNPVYDAAS
jgi:hypothetical protein